MDLPKRGATSNPRNRFERLEVELDDEFAVEARNPATQFLRDDTQTLISYAASPDVGFSASINPYRGCEHGCAYCYARPYHEYLGFSAGLDFETRIMVKLSAPQILRQELSSPKWRPQPVAMSGVTDCYQPIERKLQITRQCLGVLAEFQNPVVIVTKNHLVTRDADILSKLAAIEACTVNISVTTLNAELSRRMEPRASLPEHRLDAMRQLRSAGIPVRVLVAPVIPGLNDHEIPLILASATEAGASGAGYVLLRLPYGVKNIFSDWLARHYPGSEAKILDRIRATRSGSLSDPRFGTRMSGEGPEAEAIRRLFEVSVKRAGLNAGSMPLSTASFRNPAARQLELL